MDPSKVKSQGFGSTSKIWPAGEEEGPSGKEKKECLAKIPWSECGRGGGVHQERDEG